MAENKPETIAYVSNAGDPSISMLSMDRATGALELLNTVTIPDVKPSPTSMPLAVSADRRFLHAALRSEPFTIASFAIDGATGALRHLGKPGNPFHFFVPSFPSIQKLPPILPFQTE